MQRTKTAIAVIVLAATGIPIMGYLAYLHAAGSKSSFCDLTEGLSCSTVNASIYSEIFGIPVSWLGLGYFATILILALRGFERHARTVVLLTLFALVPSLALTVIEATIIKSFCLFCEISKALMIAIAALSWRAANRPTSVPPRAVMGILVFGLIASGIMYAVQSGIATSRRDYAELAQCLTAKGVKEYGTFWCANCAREKKEFGAAHQYIAYVECDPRGENADVTRCVELDIKHTPAWIQEDGDGKVLQRFEGFQGPEKLAELFDCPLPEE